LPDDRSRSGDRRGPLRSTKAIDFAHAGIFDIAYQSAGEKSTISRPTSVHRVLGEVGARPRASL
jgi:hypothetical protein